MSKLIDLYAHYNETTGMLVIQPSKYIEDGWYIENRGDVWGLYEIPSFGGEPNSIDSYYSFDNAYSVAKTLT